MGVMMEISCPECSKKYKIDESLIPDKGRKVKCKKCGTVFFVQKEQKKEDNQEFNLDLDFGEVQNNVGQGTVRISRDQIQASINSAKKSEEEVNEGGKEENKKIELDIDINSPLHKDKQQDAINREMSKQKAEQGEELYKVKIDGKVYNSLTVDTVKEWIEEDRLLEADFIAREGSNNWINVDKVPKFKKVIDMHVYSQRKMLEEEDNPYKKFKEQQEKEVHVKKESFFSRILKIFRKG
jgi:predicted Zn finger-like uncharacterized protein